MKEAQNISIITPKIQIFELWVMSKMDKKIRQFIQEKLSNNKCNGKTKNGKPCTRKPQSGKTTCFQH